MKNTTDRQVIADNKRRTQQAPDGQVVAQDAEQEEEITTVLNVVTGSVTLEPITSFIMFTTRLV